MSMYYYIYGHGDYLKNIISVCTSSFICEKDRYSAFIVLLYIAILFYPNLLRRPFLFVF